MPNKIKAHSIKIYKTKDPDLIKPIKTTKASLNSLNQTKLQEK